MRFYSIPITAAVVLCAFAAPIASAQASTTWYVNSSTGSDSNAGTSTSPFKDFEKAYASSTAGDTINLTGTFSWTDPGETGTTSPAGWTIGKNVTITGQSASTTFVEAATASTSAKSRVFTISSGVTATIENLNIRYGHPPTGDGYYGGAIQNNGTLYAIADEIDNNISDNGGAGIDNLDLLYVASSTVDNNLCNGSAGMGCGLLNDYDIVAGGYMTVTDSTIAYNTITADTGYYSGAGIHFRAGSGTLTNDTIAYNSSCESAVGMDTSAGIMTIKNTIIADNLYESGSYCTSGIPINFQFRTSGQGNVVDNGDNVIGYSPNYYTWAGSGDWYQSTNGGVFTLHGATTTGSVNLSSTLAQNNSLNGAPTLALSSGSVAINNGGTGSNGATSTVPALDERGASRSGATDIGAYEYGGIITGVTEPQISAIASTTGTTTATITWTTDESATSTVNFGTTTAYGLSSTSASLVTSHSIVLTGLATSTLYHFQVSSEDGSNNVATSSDYTFLTTTPPDTTPPVVVILTPASGSTASGTAVLLSASSSDNVAVAGVTFYINGTKIGSEATSSNTIFSEYWDSTATSSGSYTIFAVSRDTSNNYATSTSVAFTVLNSGETPTLVSSNVSATSTRITWTTASAASSQVFFGPSALYGSSTSQLDTSSRVTSHSVTIYAPVQCAVYHYEVVSVNSGGDSATSSDQTFTTAGCIGSSTISTIGSGNIATSTGGTVSGTGLTLTVPSNFTATSSAITFQENSLATSTFFSAAGVPAAGLAPAPSQAVEITAFIDASTTLTTFASPLTVTLSYVPSDIAGLATSSLWIYRYDSGVWTALNNCTTNTTALTVSCTTMNFSDFAIFGEPSGGGAGGSSGGDSITAGGGGGSVQSQYATLIALGLTAQADKLAAQYPWLFPNVADVSAGSASTSTASGGFTRYLQEGMRGNDVMLLQQFLNSQGFEVAASGPGSSGNETDYFGYLTKAALVQFQNAHAAAILAPAGVARGTGIFGLYTMSAVNSILKAN